MRSFLVAGLAALALAGGASSAQANVDVDLREAGFVGYEPMASLRQPLRPARAWLDDEDVRPARRRRRDGRHRHRSRHARPPHARRAALRPVPVGSGITGVASYYWQGHTTASGAHFDPDGLTAAHRTLPFGTRVRVTHLGNGRSVTVRINDRGPFIRGRIIDLSRGAAGVLGMRRQGVARVQVTVLGR